MKPWTFRRFGIVKELARPDRLLLDFDFRRVPRLRSIWAVCRIVGLRPAWIRTDRTRHGWHAVIQLCAPLTNAEIVACQAIMGSDSRREALNLMRVIAIRQRDPGPAWRDRWNILFERKLT